MLTHHKSTTSMEIHTEEEQTTCEQLLHQHLQDMKEKIQDYEQQLNAKKQTLNDFTSNAEEMIQSLFDNRLSCKKQPTVSIIR
ncbi:unnamed protein product [Rotaria socialis]